MWVRDSSRSHPSLFARLSFEMHQLLPAAVDHKHLFFKVSVKVCDTYPCIRNAPPFLDQCISSQHHLHNISLCSWSDHRLLVWPLGQEGVAGCPRLLRHRPRYRQLQRNHVPNNIRLEVSYTICCCLFDIFIIVFLKNIKFERKCLNI